MERMIRLGLPCFLTHRALIVPTLSLSLSPINFFVFTRGLLARVCVCALVIHPFRFRSTVPAGGLIVRESTHTRTRATMLAQRVR
jgi:hypothetical protein